MSIVFIVSPNATATSLASMKSSDSPYLHDPVNSLAFTETQSTTVQSLEADHRYTSITISSTVGFPDEAGFLVLGLGFDYQVGPVPYLGIGGVGQLLLDPSFIIPIAVPAGATINLAARMSDNQMPHGDGDFWLTPSPAGRSACGTDIDSISAGGRTIVKTILYPGDIGLGGAGLPTHGVPRLTDAVSVWGSDDLDTEVAEARES